MNGEAFELLGTREVPNDATLKRLQEHGAAELTAGICWVDTSRVHFAIVCVWSCDALTAGV